MILAPSDRQALTGYVRQIRRPQYVVLIRARVEQRRKLCGFESVDVPGEALPLDRLRDIGMVDGGPGIYFLWRGPQLVYVGQSTNVMNRIIQHEDAGTFRNSRGKAMPWTSATSFRCKRDDLDACEALYIRAYRPPFNDKVP